MESTRKDNGDLVFTRTFDAIEEGVYEYKFRLGVGDWWVTDETSEISECYVLLPSRSHEANAV